MKHTKHDDETGDALRALALVAAWAAVLLLIAYFVTPKVAFAVMLVGGLVLAYRLVTDSWDRP